MEIFLSTCFNRLQKAFYCNRIDYGWLWAEKRNEQFLQIQIIVTGITNTKASRAENGGQSNNCTATKTHRLVQSSSQSSYFKFEKHRAVVLVKEKYQETPDFVDA